MNEKIFTARRLLNFKNFSFVDFMLVSVTVLNLNPVPKDNRSVLYVFQLTSAMGMGGQSLHRSLYETFARKISSELTLRLIS